MNKKDSISGEDVIRVGMFSYYFFPLEGGVGRHVYEIRNILQTTNKVKLFIFSPRQNTLKNHRTIFSFSTKIGRNDIFLSPFKYFF